VLAKSPHSGNHQPARPHRLILIDAPFSSRLSRYTPVDFEIKFPGHKTGRALPDLVIQLGRYRRIAQHFVGLNVRLAASMADDRVHTKIRHFILAIVAALLLQVVSARKSWRVHANVRIILIGGVSIAPGVDQDQCNAEIGCYPHIMVSLLSDELSKAKAKWKDKQ
jgi:hypothetical protein